MKASTGFCAACVALAFASTAWAQSTPMVTLKCGGVGIEESRRMLAEQSSHALTIIFATQSGSYVSRVNTRIASPRADIAASSTACGPIGQVDVVEPGRYRVAANLDGVMLEQSVELKPAGGQRIVLRWPD